MAINPALLIAAPMLQDYFVDNANGAAMSAGIISMYHDNARTTFKNWYYQTGSPGAYSYLPLDNPLTLSAVGTITDPNGVDTIPFYYPFATDNSTPDPYYVVVVDSNGQQQFVRQNFPFEGSGSPFTTGVNTLDNLIINNEFWRNCGSVDLTTIGTADNTVAGVPYGVANVSGTNLNFATLCPSQHDGYTMADIQFFKDVNGAADTITFLSFVNTYTDQILINDVTPEYYLNFDCTGTGSETVKYIQIPIQLHVKSLSSYGINAPTSTAAVTVQLASVTGNPNVTLYLYQYLGSGVTSPNAKPLRTLNLSQAWTKATILFSFPSADTSTISAGQDDAFYLQIGLPVGSAGVANINIAMPSLFLSNEVPTNSFQTYDQINSVISSPRTGDVKVSMNTFAPFGWVAANDGSIGSVNSMATTRKNNDTWPLFNYIWNNVLEAWAPISGGTRGANAYADFSANKTLTLPRTLGRVLAGLNAYADVPQTFTTNVGVNVNTLIVTSSALFPTGTPVQLTTAGSLPSNLSAGVVYYAVNISSTLIALALTIDDAYSSTLINIGLDGTGSIMTVIGGRAGTSVQTLVSANLPSPISVNIASTVIPNVASTAGTTVNSIGGSSETPTSIAVTGTPNTPFSLLQPTTFFNFFFKL